MQQTVRETTDPRIHALADRMDSLVAQMRRERVDHGLIDPETSAAFRDTDAAYWRIFEEPDATLSPAEQEQVDAAMSDYDPDARTRRLHGARADLVPLPR